MSGSIAVTSFQSILIFVWNLIDKSTKTILLSQHVLKLVGLTFIIKFSSELLTY